jgi:hypothetical protein
MNMWFFLSKVINKDMYNSCSAAIKIDGFGTGWEDSSVYTKRKRDDDCNLFKANTEFVGNKICSDCDFFYVVFLKCTNFPLINLHSFLNERKFHFSEVERGGDASALSVLWGIETETLNAAFQRGGVWIWGSHLQMGFIPSRWAIFSRKIVAVEARVAI